MTHTMEHIGLIVIFGIVMIPVYMMIAGWLFGEPREYRPIGVGLGYMLGFAIAIIAALAVLGAVISVIMSI